MTQVAHTLAQLESIEADHPETLTLLDLVAAISDEAETDEEVVATIQHLIESGKVTLVGNFRSGDVERRRR
ncbi:MAG: hypothetical protein FJ108_08490 [Deltaproteobacteria bacterium]|nr:hypothetical protein [Deltaproteobacteria bacterium]